MRAPFVFATLAVLAGAAWLFTSESTPPRLAAERVNVGAVAEAAEPLTVEPQMASPAPAVRAPVAEPSNRIRVRGRVIDVDGKPVTRGEIYALPLDDAPSTLLRFPRATEVRLDAGGGGRFELDLDGPSELTLSTGSPSERTITSALVHSRAAAAEEYEIVVASIVCVRGVIVDDEGKGLDWLNVRASFPAGALARLAGADPSRRRWHPVRAGVPDQAGGFKLLAPRIPGAVLELTYDDEVVATQSLPNQDAEGLRFVVPNETVRGVLVRPDGTPIVGAMVFDGPGEAYTDAHGGFALPREARVLANRWLRIKEQAGHCVTLENFGRRWLARDPAAEFRIVFDGLPHGIRGTLLNADGTPAAGWYVVVSGRPAQDAQNVAVFRDTFPSGATTAADGTFSIGQLARGGHELYFRSPDDTVGFRCADIQSGRSELVVRVPDDAIVPVLRGRLVTTGGEPVRNMPLTFDVAAHGDCVVHSGKKKAITDAEGFFEARGISREATVVGARAVGTRFVPLDREPLLVEPGDRATIRLDTRTVVVFEIRRFETEGDRIVVFDAQDRPTPCWVRAGDIGSAAMYEGEMTCLPLDREGTLRFEVGQSAACIAVYSPRGLVARVPVKLDPAQENSIIWR